MSKSFVYNTGEGENKLETLNLVYGVFIDGTLNNVTNTDLRRKYRVESASSTITEDKKKADLKFESKKFEPKTGPLTQFEATRQRNIMEDVGAYERYQAGIKRSMIDKQGTDNSYSNDYTNIGRMWQYSEKVYRIYVEGMGTDNAKQDSQDGFAFGSGLTGIRARVRKACELLAQNIQDEKNKSGNSEKKLESITVDVFGFSRGAASARNFIYEINKAKTYDLKKISIPDGYYPIDPYSEGMPVRKYRDASGDSDGLEVDTAVLKDGKLPKMGHLGYSLLKNKVLKEKEFEDLRIIIRFVGLYDTVSSYYEVGALGSYDVSGNLKGDGKFGKLMKEAWSTHFKNDIDELSLNGDADENNLIFLDRFQKMVHLTAQDEHRRNFSLTRINKMGERAIEKNLPGVHCDIGGAYENEDQEYIDEIGTSLMDSQYKATLMSRLFYPFVTQGLRALKSDLVEQHWYDEEQLDIQVQFGWVPPFTSYTKLSGTRKIKKEYSYIPLHFMEAYCKPLMEKHLLDDLTVQYSIDAHPLLIQAKSYLEGYLENEEQIPEWKFMSDEDFEKKKQELAQKESERKAEEERKKLELYLEQNKPDFEGQKQYWPTMPEEIISEPEFDPNLKTYDIEEVTVTAYHPHILLRKLRKEYFHWSSNRDWFGMEPDTNRKRRITKPGEK